MSWTPHNSTLAVYISADFCRWVDLAFAIGLPEIDVWTKIDACSSRWENFVWTVSVLGMFFFLLPTFKWSLCLFNSASQTLLRPCCTVVFSCFLLKIHHTSNLNGFSWSWACRLDFAEWCLSHPEYKDMVGSAMFLAESQAVANAMRPFVRWVRVHPQTHLYYFKPSHVVSYWQDSETGKLRHFHKMFFFGWGHFPRLYGTIYYE